MFTIVTSRGIRGLVRVPTRMATASDHAGRAGIVAQEEVVDDADVVVGGRQVELRPAALADAEDVPGDEHAVGVEELDQVLVAALHPARVAGQGAVEAVLADYRGSAPPGRR